MLREFPSDSVHCVATSPPYFGLRDYGSAGQIGLETLPAEYVDALAAVFEEVRRVLRPDGTLWLNLGDSYNGAGRKGHGARLGYKQNTDRASAAKTDTCRLSDGSLKPKDLLGIPWRVAFALQTAGWYLRQDIIWAKPNPMPESVKDRCTKAHEYLFLLSKNAEYYYDAKAIAEKSLTAGDARHLRTDKKKQLEPLSIDKGSRKRTGKPTGTTKNKRSVWSIQGQPFTEAHFATFPPVLIEPCVLAGCSAGGIVLDPFGGAGTTALVAQRLGRGSVYIDVSRQYADMAAKRITKAYRDRGFLRPAPIDMSAFE